MNKQVSGKESARIIITFHERLIFLLAKNSNLEVEHFKMVKHFNLDKQNRFNILRFDLEFIYNSNINGCFASIN